ncbi:hypothetical protein BGX27_004103 [Mortierella sp. AM989]|nr:hypothetical protein BGX27_004103 [Mortierella sp. AM989]
MDNPINGDKYIRTLSHYLRSNQRRLLPPTLSSTPENSTANTSANNNNNNNLVSSAAAANVRSFVTPADPMAAAYQSMVNSLWNATSSVVSSITPASLAASNNDPQEHEKDYSGGGSFDGTRAILPDRNPSESRLYLQAQLRSPIFPLDLYYLLYLLERFEQVGIDLEGWEGTTTRAVGDSKPRVIFPSAVNAAGNGVSNSAFQPKDTNGNDTTRPQSIRSFSSTAVSTLTLITGWKQWSTAASFNSSNLTVTDDIHFIRKFLKHIPTLRLVAKIPPGNHVQGKGRIEGFNADAMLSLFNHGQSLELNGSSSDSNGSSSLMLFPLPAIFNSLTHLELHKIPPGCIEGWETLMKQLKSLVIIQSGIEDVYDVIVTAVVNSEKRRLQRISREKSRAVQIKEEQQEALKDAALTTQGLSTVTAKDDETYEGSNGSASISAATDLEDAIIMSSLKMWPILRHLSFSDNSLPSLTHSDTFMHTQSIASLDLSHNLFLSPPSGLIHLHNLNDLDLSYNMISGVQSIYQVLGNISVLNLRGNRLESLSGLERLWNLEKADVRENHLDEAAEIGRLAALPGIREVWAERNPFCSIQPKYRLEILAVFKANGHDLLLDGTFASFTEKRALANLSPSSFTTTISSINNVANIPAASAPVATFAQELNHQNNNHSRAQSTTEAALTATSKTSPGTSVTSPISKLTKKKLVKSTKRVKRVVNLDSDHEDEHGHEHETSALADMDVKELDGSLDGEATTVASKAYQGVLGSPATIAVKKKKKKNGKTSPTSQAKGGDTPAVGESNGHHNHGHSKEDGHNHGEEHGTPTKPKKRVTRKKNVGITNVSFAGDHEEQVPNSDQPLYHDNHQVHRHRLAHLEKSMSSLQLERPSAHQRQPSKGILKRNTTMPISMAAPTPTAPHKPHSGSYTASDAISPRLRPSSPIGSFSSDDGGADGYRRKIEAMRNEAGKNWLMVLAEMDTDSTTRDPTKTNGASVSKSISLQDYSSEGAGRGVVASADIKKDEELFLIPRPLLLSPETSELPKKIDLTSLQGWNPLMMCMIYEYCRGDASHWKPYFDILPTEFTTPMFWSSEELLELKGTGVVDKIGRDEAESIFNENLWPLIHASLDIFDIQDKDKASFLKIFHRMGSLIMAYAFHDTIPGSGDDDAMDEYDEDEEEEEEKVNVSMVPMADMLNHRTGFNNARLFHEKDCLRMVAIKPIKTGQQIYNTYGDLCNADLLRKYGFVDVPNPHNIAEISGDVVVAKFTAGNEDSKEEIVEWLLEQDALEDYFILESDAEIPEDLVGCAKILMMPIEEFKTTVIQGKKIPSTKLTVEVQKILRELLEEKIAEYESNAKDDKVLLKQPVESLPVNRRNAVIVRSGEREIVQSVLDKVKKWKPPTPTPAASSAGRQKGNAKGQHPNKGKKPYQKK